MITLKNSAARLMITLRMQHEISHDLKNIEIIRIF